MAQDNASTDKVKVYLDYLEKEMTIMGILSTFCIVALGFIAEKLLFPDKEGAYHFWQMVPCACFLGLAGLAGGGFYFYAQRSKLAFFYGELSLYIARNQQEEIEKALDDTGKQFDWQSYHFGFGCLFLAFTELAIVCLSSVCPFLQKHECLIDGLVLFLCVSATAIFARAYSRFGGQDKPLVAWWEKITKSKRRS